METCPRCRKYSLSFFPARQAVTCTYSKCGYSYHVRDRKEYYEKFENTILGEVHRAKLYLSNPFPGTELVEKERMNAIKEMNNELARERVSHYTFIKKGEEK